MFLSVDNSDITNHTKLKLNPNLYIGCRNHSSNKLDRIYPNLTRIGLTMYCFPLYYRNEKTHAVLHFLHNTTSSAQHKIKPIRSTSQKNLFLDNLSFIQDKLIGVTT